MGRRLSVPVLLGLAAAAILLLSPPAIHPASRVLASFLILLAAYRPGWGPGDTLGLAGAVLPWLLALLAGAFLSPDPRRALVPLLDLSLAALAGLVLGQLSQDEKKTISLGLTLISFFALGQGLLQVWGGLAATAQDSYALGPLADPAFSQGVAGRLGAGRAFGPFVLPGVFGCFCGMMFFHSLALRDRCDSGRERVFWTLSALAQLLGLGLSRSLSAWLALALTWLVLLLRKKGRRPWAGLVVALMGFGLALQSRGWRLVRSDSVEERLSLWKEVLALAWKSGLLGLGPGRLAAELAATGSEHYAQHAHCLPLELLGELGFLGLLVFGWFLWRLRGSFLDSGLSRLLIFSVSQACVDLTFQQAEILFLFFILLALGAPQPPAPSLRRLPRPAGNWTGLSAWLLLALAGAAPLLYPDPRMGGGAALAAALLAGLALSFRPLPDLYLPGRILVLLAAWSLVSAWSGNSAGAGAPVLGLAATALLLCAASASALSQSRWRLRLAWALGLGSGILGFWALFQWLSGTEVRGRGPFTNPNLMAGALLPGLFYLGLKAAKGGPGRIPERGAAALLFLAALGGLIASGSWAALASGLVLACAGLILAGGAYSWAALGAASLAALSLRFFPSFSRAGDLYSSFRVMIWRAAAEAVASRPWFGSGPGQGGWLLLAHSPEDGTGPFRFDHGAADPHSSLLRLGLEAGAPALALGLFLFLVLVLMRFKGALARSPDPERAGLSLGLLALMLHGVTEEVFLSPGVLLLAAALLGSLLGSLGEEKPGRRPREAAVLWVRGLALVLAAAGPAWARGQKVRDAGQPGDPAAPALWMELGDARAGLYLSGSSPSPARSLQGALTDFEKAQELAPLDPYIPLHRARLLAAALEKGDLGPEGRAPAWEGFELAAALAPRLVLIPWEAAQTAGRLGEEARAEAWLLRAAEVEPNFVAPRRQLAILRAGTAQGPAAKLDLARAERALQGYEAENSYCRDLVEAGR